MDYSEAPFIRKFEREENTYFACFVPEIIAHEGELSPSGRYYITMLHPSRGTVTFYLRTYGGDWLLDVPSIVEKAGTLFAENPFEIEEELITWCGEQIDGRQA